MELVEGIEANDEGERGWLKGRKKMADGVYRVGGAPPLELYRRGREERVVSHGQLDHLQTMRRRGDVAATLMGRPGGGHEVDPVERERFAYLLGAAQMPEVNGIKGAAEQSYSHTSEWGSGVGGRDYIFAAVHSCFH